MLTAKVPKKITILLTHNCNQKCEFCFDASNIVCNSITPYMSLETVDKIITLLLNSFDDISSFNITLSGGEPSLHPQFLEIIKRFSLAGFPLTILSNGQNFADKTLMGNVLDYNIYNLQFSIEGASAEMHDYRVGCLGAFEKVLKAIENAQDFGIRFITNTTVTNNSIAEMFGIIDLIDSLNVLKMNIGNTLPECAGRNYSVIMSYPEVIEIAEKLTLYAMTKQISFSFITPLPFCLKENRVISNPSVCSAGHYSIVIDVDGTIRPCSVCNPPFSSFPMINALDSYSNIYDELKPIIDDYLTSEIPQECRKCTSFKTCKSACPLYWRVPGVETPSKWVQTIN